MFDHSEYVNSYSQLVIRAWSSQEYLDFVQSQPKLALADVGITVPDDATVEVEVVPSTGTGKIEDQIARWEAGHETGVFRLVIAERPDDFDPEDMNINDLALSGIAGGAEYGDNGTGDTGDGSIGIYCCCTPCCCCG